MRSSVQRQHYSWSSFSNDFYSIEPALGSVKLYNRGLVDNAKYLHAQQDDQSISYDFDVDTIRMLLNDGGTIVANRFDKSSAYVADLCREVSAITNNQTVANAYATKGGDGTFGNHWDTHCVFALQLIGCKRWKVYEPTMALPLELQTSAQEKAQFGGVPVFDDILSEGDAIYIPRGWWHEALPIGGQASLHVAIGVHSIKVHDFIQWLLRRKLTNELTFRKSLNRSGFNYPLLSDALRVMAEHTVNPAVFDEFLQERSASINVKQRIDFTEILKSETLHADT